MSRLGGGEVEPEDRLLSMREGQVLFLEAIAAHVEDVLKDLQDDVLTVYQQATRGNPRQPLTVGRILRASDLFERRLLELRTALVTWATYYRLTDTAGTANLWILDTAVNSLAMWSTVTFDSGVPLSWELPTGALRYPISRAELKKMNLAAVEIDLTRETRNQAERRLLDFGMTQRSTREHVNQLLSASFERGFVRTPHFRDRSGILPRAFELLAVFVCDGHRQTVPANQLDITRQSVSEMLNRLAGLIDLKLPHRFV